MKANIRTAGIVGVVLVAITALLLASHRWQRVLETGLPPRVQCASQPEAAGEAIAFAQKQGLRWSAVLGTGSMAPYIPPAVHGQDPKTTVVAYAVFGGSFEDIKPGTLCVYRAGWNPAMLVIHGAAQKDSSGWIMSGLNNAHSESRWRVTPGTFVGVVRQVYVWPLNP